MLDNESYWARNYLCIGQIYLFDNLCFVPAQGRADQARLLGTGDVAWSELHLHSSDRLIKEHELTHLHLGPGHGGPSSMLLLSGRLYTELPGDHAR